MANVFEHSGPHPYFGVEHMAHLGLSCQEFGQQLCAEDRPPTTADELRDVFQESVELAKAKDQGYGAAWRAQGYVGNLARVLSKAERLRNLAWRDEPAEGALEAVEEELRDIINIAAFALVNVRQGNRWGRNTAA